MRFLLALICSITALYAQEESKLPLEAQKLIAAYDADAAKIRADAEKQVEKKSAELADKLAKVQDSATKRGDLDGAVALKTKIAALGSGTTEEAKPKPKKPAAPFKDETGGRYVVLFNEADYGGMKIKVPVPTEISQVMTLGFPNDALRSIQVPPGVIVKLYDADMGGGAETIITESTSDLAPLTKVGTTSLSAKKVK